MNVIISNKYQSLLATLDIDIIKSLNGVFEVDEIVANFSNFYYNKMILDITAIKDYQNIATIQELSVNMDMSKIILLLDDLHDEMSSSENITWHYDTDFEFLNDDSIKQIIAPGPRHLDTFVRLQMAEILPDKIVHIKDKMDGAEKLDLSSIDTVYILYDVYTIKLCNMVKERVIKMIKEKEEEKHEN